MQLVLLTATVTLTLASINLAQGRDDDSTDVGKQSVAVGTPTPAGTPEDLTTQKKKKRGNWILAPIPILSPALGVGVVPVVGYVFKLKENDKTSPPSVLAFVGVITNNGTRVGALGGRLYFSENKYQTAFAIVKANVNVDFYGIGRLPGRESDFVPLRAKGDIFFGEFLRNVGKSIFIGPRFQYRRLAFGIDGEQEPGDFQVPEIDVRSKSNSLGFKIQRDTRDSTFYPTRGSLFETKADFYGHWLGSVRQNQVYSIAYNGFHSLNEKRVVAYRAMVCSAFQSVPFYNLCLFGANNDLRGYTGGEFQDRRMFAMQGELRQHLKGRFGLVFFGGVGGIAPRWSGFRSDQLLPAAGAGLRFTLDKKNRINYRVDWAVGRAGNTLVIGVGEAF